MFSSLLLAYLNHNIFLVCQLATSVDPGGREAGYLLPPFSLLHVCL